MRLLSRYPIGFQGNAKLHLQILRPYGRNGAYWPEEVVPGFVVVACDVDVVLGAEDVVLVVVVDVTGEIAPLVVESDEAGGTLRRSERIWRTSLIASLRLSRADLRLFRVVVICVLFAG